MNSENPEDSDLDRIEKLEKRVAYLESIIDGQHTAEASGTDTVTSESHSTSSTRESDRGYAERFKEKFSIPTIQKENWLY